MSNQVEDFSFSNWVEMYKYARAIGFRVLRDRHLAEDCAQQSCLKGFECRLTPPLPKPKSYFGSLAYHVAVRVAGREAARKMQPLTSDPEDTSGSSNADAAKALIEAILEKLKPKTREVLKRRVLEGQANQDAAEELGLSKSGAAMQKARALAEAREVALKLVSGQDPV